MKACIVATALSLILAATIVSCTAPNAQQPEAENTETAKTPVKVVVKEWTGSGSKTTEPFVIDSDYWVIAWAFAPEPVAGIYANFFGITVQKPNDDFYFNSPVGISNKSEPISDYSYIYEKGTFYLDISSMSGDWAIQIITFE